MSLPVVPPRWPPWGPPGRCRLMSLPSCPALIPDSDSDVVVLMSALIPDVVAQLLILSSATMLNTRCLG